MEFSVQVRWLLHISITPSNLQHWVISELHVLHHSKPPSAFFTNSLLRILWHPWSEFSFQHYGPRLPFSTIVTALISVKLSLIGSSVSQRGVRAITQLCAMIWLRAADSKTCAETDSEAPSDLHIHKYVMRKPGQHFSSWPALICFASWRDLNPNSGGDKPWLEPSPRKHCSEETWNVILLVLYPMLESYAFSTEENAPRQTQQ